MNGVNVEDSKAFALGKSEREKKKKTKNYTSRYAPCRDKNQFLLFAPGDEKAFIARAGIIRALARSHQ